MPKFILKKAKRVLKQIRILSNYKLEDLERRYYYQSFPKKPITINFQANDICNSKCTMCYIWKQKRDKELSPGEFEKILKDELFTDVTSMGITGGEPTLRKDLPKLYEAACKALPNVTSFSIITNAIQEKSVIERIERSAEVCAKYGKSFTIMISLDGVDEIHDEVRGIHGNYHSAMKVVQYFKKNTDINTIIGCTITKDNVWHVDDLLDLLIEKNIYGRFRIAEFIIRLYNEKAIDIIRNFDEDESYHLAVFFEKLILKFENNEQIKRTYRSIQNMLLGGERLIACPYQDHAISLDCRGDIYYCAPKSKNLGNSLKVSGWKIYKKNLKERKRLLNEDCLNCIHDYHAPITFNEQFLKIKENFWRQNLTLNRIGRLKVFTPKLLSLKKSKSKKKRIFIVGWYGTETVGDKAILGSILDYYKNKYSNLEFSVSAIYPIIVNKTLRELGEKAKIIPYYSYDFIKYSALSDEVVMGGGPLMDMEALSIPLWAFSVAKRYNRKTIIFGCGIGPLHSQKYVQIVEKILKLSDEIKLRDTASVDWAEKHTGRKDIINVDDPAFYYVKKKNEEIKVEREMSILACYLREWPINYKGNYTDYEYVALKRDFEQNLATSIIDICKSEKLTPAFYSMHTFTVGDDDRDFYRSFINAFFKNFTYYFEKKTSSVEMIIESMKTSKYCLCMRFHSVLFAETLNRNYVAIDYTLGGKIKGYLSDNDSLDKLVTIKEITNNHKILYNKLILSRPEKNENTPY